MQPLRNLDSDVEIEIGAAGALLVYENLVVAWFNAHMLNPNLALGESASRHLPDGGGGVTAVAKMSI